MNDRIKILTKKDLNKFSKHVPYWSVNMYRDFSIPKEDINNADFVAFKDRYNINIMKNRYGTEYGCTDSDKTQTQYERLQKLDPFGVMTICNIQQKMLSDVFEFHHLYNLKYRECILISKVLQCCWYTREDRDELNNIRIKYKSINK